VLEETVGAGYFATLGEPMLAGREFVEPDQRSHADGSRTLPGVGPRARKNNPLTQVAQDAFGFRIQIALERDIEGDAGLERSDPGEQALLLPILLDVVVRHRDEITIRRLLKHHQVFGIRRCRQITK
jgi:hypothetical protein